MRLRLSIVLAAAVVACGRSSTPTAPTPNISGNWSGTMFSTQSGNGELAFTLTQRGLSLLPPGTGQEQELTGTWSGSFLNANADGMSGTASGTVSQSSVTLALTPGVTGCAYSLTATLTGAVSMSGTWTTSNCPYQAGGALSATRQ